MSGDTKDGVHIKRKITLLNGVTITIGSIIGSGIFVSPAGVYKELHSPGGSLVIWLASGLFSFLGAACFCELGTTVPKSGGDYVYILEAFGPLPAFLRLWTSVLVFVPTTVAIVALAFAQYAAKPFFPGCSPPENAIRLFAAACICLLTAINCISVRWSLRIQDICTSTKLFALLAIIVAGTIHLCNGHTEYFESAFEGNYTPKSITLAFYSGLFAFAGWNCLNFVTGELQNPSVNLPRAVWISMPIVIVVYVLVNMAYLAVIPPEELVSSPAVAVAFGIRMFGSFYWVVPVFVALSTFGGVNGLIFTGGRLYLQGAQENQLPDVFSLIHIKRATPIPATIFVCLTSLLMLLSADIFALINYFSFILWLNVGLCILGMLIMRRTRPELPRPFRLPVILSVVFMCACLLLVAVPAVVQPIDSVIGVLIIALTGVPVYYICVQRHSKSKYLDQASAMLTRMAQIWLEVVNPDEAPKIE